MRPAHRPLLLPLVAAAIALPLVGCDARTAPDAPAENAPAAVAPAAVEDASPAAADAAAPLDDGTLVAAVNGAPIEMAEFQRQAFDTQRYFVEQGLDPNTPEGQRELLALRRQVLLDMINQRLVEQEAAARGIAVTDDEVRASLAETRAKLGGDAEFEASIAAADTTEEEVFTMERNGLVGQRVFEAVTADVPEMAPFVRARHILCGDEAACQAALARLDAGESFADVAREASVDTLTADKGGDLDWIPRLDGFVYLPSADLQSAILALRPGQRSGVVKTDFGYHILEVVEEDPSRELPPERRLELRARAMQDWLTAQRGQADVVIYVDDLKNVVGDG